MNPMPIFAFPMYKVLLLVLGFFLLHPAAIGQNSLADIIGDVTLPHEGKPHGVPTSWDWACQPRAGLATPPTNWTAAIAWGQVYEWIEGNPATNTRVQIKDMEMYYLSRIDSSWHLLQQTTSVAGAAYREDFANDENKAADLRQEPDGGVSITAGDGYNFHFWPTSGRSEWPVNEVIGCFVTVKARLILDDPNEVDDRNIAKYLISVGGDWWESLSAVWDNWTTNADMGIGRFRFITREWKSFNMISIPIELAERIPPPFDTGLTSTGSGALSNFKWQPAFPNPFQNQVQGSYSLTSSQRVTLSLIDPAGRVVDTLFSGWQSKGTHQLSYESDHLAPGVYLLRFLIGGSITHQKLLKVKR